MFKDGNYNTFDTVINADLQTTETYFETEVVPFLPNLWEGFVGKNALVTNEKLDAGFEFDESNSALPTAIKFRMTFFLEDFQVEDAEAVEDKAITKDKETISKYFAQFEKVTCDPEDVEIDLSKGLCEVTVHIPISTTTFILDELKAEKEEEEKKEEERLKASKDEEEKDEYGFNLL